MIALGSKTISLAKNSLGMLEDIFGNSCELNIEDHLFIGGTADGFSGALAETLIHNSKDNPRISIRLSPVLAKELEEGGSPFEELTNSNLAKFSILAEEISHFDNICFAVLNNREISRWDLELQSEFDKILMAATLLKQQTGHHHLRHLARILFDSSRIYDLENIFLYESTGNTAAAWWWSQINRFGDHFLEERFAMNTLFNIRKLSGSSKIALIDKTRIGLKSA